MRRLQEGTRNFATKDSYQSMVATKMADVDEGIE